MGVEPVADLLVKGLVAAIPALFAVEGAAAAGAIVFHGLRLLYESVVSFIIREKSQK